MTNSSSRVSSVGIYKEVPVERVFVDHAYQQPLDEKWANHLAQHWSQAACGALLVSQRADGTFATPDGQHRLVAMRAKGIQFVAAEVHYNLTLEQEADLFLSRNNRKMPSGIAKFIARCVRGDEDALEIKKILKAAGAQIGFQSRSSSSNGRYYQCVDSIARAYRDDYLEDAVHIIEICWGDLGNQARSKIVFDGVYTFLKMYGYLDKFSMDRALDKFSKRNLASLIAATKNNATATGTSQSYQFARLLREAYNKGARTSVLPEMYG